MPTTAWSRASPRAAPEGAAKDGAAKDGAAKDWQVQVGQLALADARVQTVSTLIDIKVLPKTMIHKYLSWWRVGVAQVSTSERTDAVAKTLNERLAKARQY